MDYTEIETRRKAIGGISRAQMCRRANVNESTVTKGLRLNRQPIGSVVDALLGALAELEGEVRGRRSAREAAE